MLWATAVATFVILIAACVARPQPTDGPALAGLALPWSSDSCRAATRDEDEDGLDDSCELALAQAFAPEMIVDPRDCMWNAKLRLARLSGGYLVAAGRVLGDERGVRIAYLPAYLRDCGWDGAPCMTRGPGCSAHSGDSELVVVDAPYEPARARWVTAAVFLSAHCLGRSDGRCRWYTGKGLRQFAWAGNAARGAPRIWVAKGKHANYPSRRACDSGHWSYDSCDGNTASYRFPVGSAAQNVGSRRRPLPEAGASRAGCIVAEQLPWHGDGADSDTIECFWDSGTPFRGWQRKKAGRPATAYARLLDHAAKF